MCLLKFPDPITYSATMSNAGAGKRKRVKDEDYEEMSIISISSGSESSGTDEDDAAQDSNAENDSEGEGSINNQDNTNHARLLSQNQNNSEGDDDSDSDSNHGADGVHEDVKDEDLEVIATQATRPGSPSVAPPSRGNVLLDLLNDYTPEVPDQWRFNSLPRDIKYIIISYLDYQPHSVYSLSMVSRSWYKTLNQGTHTEIDWQRRCNAMGSQRKSPHCKTWRETFIRQIRKRCLSCLSISDSSFGHLLEGQPDWLTVCSHCQTLPGPWQTISLYEAQRRQPGRYFGHLPFIAVKNTQRLLPFNANPKKTQPRKYIQFYLASSVGDPYDGQGLVFRAEDLLYITRHTIPELVAQGGRLEDIHKLLQYAENAKEGRIFRSNRLMNMIVALGGRARRSERLSDIVRQAVSYLDKVNAFHLTVQAEKERNPELFGGKGDPFSRLKQKRSRTWGDRIITGEASMEEFLDHRSSCQGAPKPMNQTPARKAELRDRRKLRKLEGLRPRKEAKSNGTSLPKKAKREDKGKKRKREFDPLAVNPAGPNGNCKNKKQRIEGSVPIVKTSSTTAAKSKKNTASKRPSASEKVSRTCACGATFAMACQHQKCGICCPGPCVKHKHKRKIDVYAKKEEDI